MQARYYDPVIGRFYSNDPVSTLGHMQRGNPIHGFNRYTYANNNPYKYTDPDGEFAFAVLLFVPEIVALAKATAFVVSAAAAGYAGSEAINAYNESANGDAIDGVKEGKSPAQGEAGAKGQLEGSGGQDGALGDLGSIPLEEGSEWSSSDGSRQGGTVGDGSGRKVNVHPSGGGDSYPQGTPTLEVQKPNGKTEVKIRYPEDTSS